MQCFLYFPNTIHLDEPIQAAAQIVSKFDLDLTRAKESSFSAKLDQVCFSLVLNILK